MNVEGRRGEERRGWDEMRRMPELLVCAESGLVEGWGGVGGRRVLKEDRAMMK